MAERVIAILLLLWTMGMFMVVVGVVCVPAFHPGPKAPESLGGRERVSDPQRAVSIFLARAVSGFQPHAGRLPGQGS